MTVKKEKLAIESIGPGYSCVHIAAEWKSATLIASGFLTALFDCLLMILNDIKLVKVIGNKTNVAVE